MAESLDRYTVGGAGVEPGLAESCQPESDFLTWTCTLRQDVQFQNNTTLDANDVVASFAIQWDASNPLHRAIRRPSFILRILGRLPNQLTTLIPYKEAFHF
jgi:ABC-type transport system substrate-binding protein